MGTITELLQRGPDDPEAFDEICRLIQSDLIAMARAQRRKERSNPLMETMDLVNLSYVRLANILPAGAHDRKHLFRLFSRAMRRVLIDHAKYVKAQKRGGGQQHVPIREGDWITEQASEHLLSLHDILEEIEAEYPIDARIYQEHVFGGLKVREVVDLLGEEPGFESLNEARVKRAVEFINTLVRRRFRSGTGDGMDS